MSNTARHAKHKSHPKLEKTELAPADYLSADPFEPGKPLTFGNLLHGLVSTAFFQIYPSLIFFGAFAAVVTVLQEKFEISLAVPEDLLPVLALLIAFVISYRTSSAYEKYNEGRKLWSLIIHASRSFSRAVWIHVPDAYSVPPPEDPEQRKKEEVMALLEKRTVINLVEAFAVAVKHNLRNQDNIYYDDLYHLVRFLPRYKQMGPRINEPSDDAPASPASIATPILVPGDEKPEDGAFDRFPLKLIRPFLYWATKGSIGEQGGSAAIKKAVKNKASDHNIPLEILYYLSSYTATLEQRGCADHTTVSAMFSSIDKFQEALTGLERILTTPIPWSYSCHVWHVAILFCILLPFQIVELFHWVTIPATVVVTFVFIGFISIAEEIQEPFGYDNNDLPLKYFVQDIIAKQLRALTSHRAPEPSKWVFSTSNKIFKKDDRRGHELRHISTDELWSILASESHSVAHKAPVGA